MQFIPKPIAFHIKRKTLVKRRKRETKQMLKMLMLAIVSSAQKRTVRIENVSFVLTVHLHRNHFNEALFVCALTMSSMMFSAVEANNFSHSMRCRESLFGKLLTKLCCFASNEYKMPSALKCWSCSKIRLVWVVWLCWMPFSFNPKQIYTRAFLCAAYTLIKWTYRWAFARCFSYSVSPENRLSFQTSSVVAFIVNYEH